MSVGRPDDGSKTRPTGATERGSQAGPGRRKGGVGTGASPRAKRKKGGKGPSSPPTEPKLVAGKVESAPKPSSMPADATAAGIPLATEPALTGAALEKAIKDVLKEVQTRYPTSIIDIDVTFKELSARPVKKQQDFLVEVKKHLEEVKAKEQQGLFGWVTSSMKGLKDRVVTYYKSSEENLAKLKVGLGSVAAAILWETRQAVAESPIGVVGGAVLAGGNLALRSAGNMAITATTFALPSTVEWLANLMTVVTGVYDPEHPELTSKQTEEFRKRLESSLHSLEMPDEPIQDMTAYMTGTIGDWLSADLRNMMSQYSPSVLLEQLGKPTKVISSLQSGAMMAVIELSLTTILMQEFGPQTLPGTAGIQPISFPTSMEGPPTTGLTYNKVSVLVFCIMTLIKNGNVPIKDAVIKLLTKKGPFALGSLGIKGSIKAAKKLALSYSNPLLAPVISYPLNKLGKKVSGGIKKGVKGGISAAMEMGTTGIKGLVTGAGGSEEPSSSVKPADQAKKTPAPQQPKPVTGGGGGRRRRRRRK